MLGDGALTFREFAMREPLPLATIHDAVLEFLRGRDDAVLYGAQAVNAYAAVLEKWNELVAQEILPEDEDAEFGGP